MVSFYPNHVYKVLPSFFYFLINGIFRGAGDAVIAMHVVFGSQAVSILFCVDIDLWSWII